MPARNIGGKESKTKKDEITLLPDKIKPEKSIFTMEH